MTAAFAHLFKQSLITFHKSNKSQLQSNFIILKKLLDQLTIHDINLDERLVSREEFSKTDKAPCTFINIFENDDIAMSVFILQNGYTMPCHDHPMMSGLLKVLSGTLLVRSFTKKPENEQDLCDAATNTIKIKVIAEPETLLGIKTESAFLTPSKKNFHEITAVNGVAAFFDILSPPYDADIPVYGKRKCNFYQRFVNDLCAAKPNNEETILEKIPAPATYYCDEGIYTKPNFLLHYEDTSCESEKS